LKLDYFNNTLPLRQRIQDICEQFFNLAWVHWDRIDVKEEESDIFLIHIESDDSKLLIGPHGKHLTDIQGLLRMIIHKVLESKVKLHIEINDYIKTKDERLFSFIEAKIKQARETQNTIELPFFTSYERKKIHSYVSELNDPSIQTESRWEWKTRRMHLVVSWDKLSIDIDGDDI
jgi:spoIIIJ-associated protein